MNREMWSSWDAVDDGDWVLRASGVAIGPAEVPLPAPEPPAPNGKDSSAEHPMVWRSKDFDCPVTVLAEAPQVKDGRMYQRVRATDGHESYVPADELVDPAVETGRSEARVGNGKAPDQDPVIVGTAAAAKPEASAALAAPAEIEFTRLTNLGGPFTKQIALVDGKMVKTPACAMALGMAERVRVADSSAFGALIESLTSEQAKRLASCALTCRIASRSQPKRS
jgi:hypothetical protein